MDGDEAPEKYDAAKAIVLFLNSVITFKSWARRQKQPYVSIYLDCNGRQFWG